MLFRLYSFVCLILFHVCSAFLTTFHQIFPTKYTPIAESKSNQWNEALLEPYRQLADPLADKCYAILYEECNQNFPPGYDILIEIERKAKEEEKSNCEGDFYKLYQQTFVLPEWVDLERVSRGAEWYTKIGFPAGAFVLSAASLVQSYGAAKGSAVLTETGRLNDDVVKRVFETGDFIYKIFQPNGLRIGGVGHLVTLRVRLLHCAIRHFLLSRKKMWNSETLGVPINQEDLAGTVCLFTSVVYSGLSKLGYRQDLQKFEDYVHLWRWVGYLLGIREELLPQSAQDIYDINYVIQRHQWGPNENSTKLVHALFNSVHRRFAYFYLSASFWHSLSRFLLGEEYANSLGISDHDPTSYLGVLFFSFLIKVQSFTHHYLPFCVWLTLFNGRIFWNIFMKIGLSGRSVDFKMKKY